MNIIVLSASGHQFKLTIKHYNTLSRLLKYKLRNRMRFRWKNASPKLHVQINLKILMNGKKVFFVCSFHQLWSIEKVENERIAKNCKSIAKKLKKHCKKLQNIAKELQKIAKKCFSSSSKELQGSALL